MEGKIQTDPLSHAAPSKCMPTVAASTSKGELSVVALACKVGWDLRHLKPGILWYV
jgi:hypothetical protein